MLAGEAYRRAGNSSGLPGVGCYADKTGAPGGRQEHVDHRSAAGGGTAPPPLPAENGIGTGTGIGGFVFNAADEERRRGVRRMKATATGLLVLVALVYALAKWAQDSGAGAWAGYVAAAAEAGMVGALADWFAVTALFRRPLGLPI
ncbi:DUF445 family protein, partial [Streptomyces goshikiensis]